MKISWARIKRWWRDGQPTKCVTCSQWYSHKDTKAIQHRIAGWVRVCVTCYDEIYPGGER